jgi:hypothetical protein
MRETYRSLARASRILTLLLSLLPTLAAPAPAEPVSPGGYDPLFLGYGSEPEMDFGGRTVASLDSAINRAIGRVAHV